MKDLIEKLEALTTYSFGRHPQPYYVARQDMLGVVRQYSKENASHCNVEEVAKNNELANEIKEDVSVRKEERPIKDDNRLITSSDISSEISVVDNAIAFIDAAANDYAHYKRCYPDEYFMLCQTEIDEWLKQLRTGLATTREPVSLARCADAVTEAGNACVGLQGEELTLAKAVLDAAKKQGARFDYVD